MTRLLNSDFSHRSGLSVSPRLRRGDTLNSSDLFGFEILPFLLTFFIFYDKIYL